MNHSQGRQRPGGRIESISARYSPSTWGVEWIVRAKNERNDIMPSILEIENIWKMQCAHAPIAKPNLPSSVMNLSVAAARSVSVNVRELRNSCWRWGGHTQSNKYEVGRHTYSVITIRIEGVCACQGKDKASARTGGKKKKRRAPTRKKKIQRGGTTRKHTLKSW